MAKDAAVYEAVCLVHGHDYFYVNDRVDGALGFCKRCGDENRIGHPTAA